MAQYILSSSPNKKFCFKCVHRENTWKHGCGNDGTVIIVSTVVYKRFGVSITVLSNIYKVSCLKQNLSFGYYNVYRE